MSEGLPRNPKELVLASIWGIFAFAAGFEAIASLVHGEWIPAIASFLLFLALVAVLLLLLFGAPVNQLRFAINSNWLPAAVAMLLLVIALSPFVEQRRWPFSASQQIAPPPAKIDDVTNQRGSLSDALPTSPDGLRSGQLWNNGGVPSIVPAAKYPDAATIDSLPQVAAQKQYSRTELDIREKAIRDLITQMGGPVRSAVLSGKKIESDGVGRIVQQGGYKALVKRLEDLKQQATDSFASINEVLIKYAPYNDVKNITSSWRYDDILSSTDEFIELLKTNPETGNQDVMWNPPTQKARNNWGRANGGFSGWFDTTMKLIADKNQQYENAATR
ncbi:MAG: hypothetical protein ACREDT_09620 [Methylocella sp.]